MPQAEQMGSAPRAEYDRRFNQRQSSAESFDRWHRRIGNARLALFVVALILAWLAFKSQKISPLWILFPACAFAVLAVLHGRILQRLQQFRRAVEFYKRGLSRLAETWEGEGEPGERFRDAAHPYSEDLDLFGKGSLFELLCSARTHGGEQTLASWLLSPAGAQEIRARQEAVEELRSNLALREDLAGLGTDLRAGVHPETLVHWGEGPARFHTNLTRIAAALIALFTLVSLGLWIDSGRHQLFVLALLVEVVFVYMQRRAVGSAVASAETAGRDLDLLASVLARLEKERFKTPYLERLRAVFDSEGKPPSRRIAQLDRLIVLLDSRRNLLFAPVALVLLWEIQLAFLIEDWRRKNGRAIGAWLEAVAELEALSSLAGA